MATTHCNTLRHYEASIDSYGDVARNDQPTKSLVKERVALEEHQEQQRYKALLYVAKQEAKEKAKEKANDNGNADNVDDEVVNNSANANDNNEYDDDYDDQYDDIDGGLGGADNGCPAKSFFGPPVARMHFTRIVSLLLGQGSTKQHHTTAFPTRKKNNNSNETIEKNEHRRQLELYHQRHSCPWVRSTSDFNNRIVVEKTNSLSEETEGPHRGITNSSTSILQS
jgi:hypothetical protein